MSESKLALSPEFQSFKSSLTRQRITVEDNTGEGVWTVYDTGPSCVRCPLIMIAPLCGTAQVYYKQVLALSSKGVRVISVEGPVCWSEGRWCSSFRHLLYHFNLDKVHLFGAGFGGYLAQKFAEITFKNPMVVSLILCNSFADTNEFSKGNMPSLFYMMPAFALKRHVLTTFPSASNTGHIADAVDFMVEQVEHIERRALASRLVIETTRNYVEPQRLRSQPITLIEAFDSPGVSQKSLDDLQKCYPEAKRAQIKQGGVFPYLSAAHEVNIYIFIHLQNFANTKHSPYQKESEPTTE